MDHNVKKMHINGVWVLANSNKIREIINPANEEIIALVTEGDEKDVKKAVKAAKIAFYEDQTWANFSAAERGALLTKVADLIEQNVNDIAMAETLNNGKTISESEGDVYGAASIFRYFGGIASTPTGSTYNLTKSLYAMTVREPIGVCGLIVPWNYPIVIAAGCIAPALAAGNTIVFKPSSITPLSAIMLFEIIEKAGFPKGVANLVLGDGRTAGSEIASNLDIDKIVFTGGTDTGRGIMKVAAANIKNLSLELGGKSPIVVFDDADFVTALDYVMLGAFLSQGEVCVSGSRLLLQEGIYDKFIDRLVERTKKIKVGPGIERSSQMGALASKSHMERVLSYIQSGIDEGAKLVCGGKRIIDGDMKKGYFVEPTIFADCTGEMKIVQEEIFGPVLVVQKFKDEKEAIKIANDTVFGLAGGIFTNDINRATHVAKGIRAGNIWINTYLESLPDVPAGGYKQSGIGRIMGTYGLESYTELKQISINLDVKPIGVFTE
jgi:betaine-aldehyde dehydrogenase